MNEILTIPVLYHEKDLPKLTHIGGKDKSNAIDLYTSEDVKLKKGEFALIKLGVSVDLPDGYKMEIRPRSSTFKNFGLIQTNGVGLVDSTYSGVDDVLMMPVFIPFQRKDIMNYFSIFAKTLLSNGHISSSLVGYTVENMLNKINELDEEVVIPKGTRLCQCEILPVMPDVEFVGTLKKNWKKENRSGFGSTGK